MIQYETVDWGTDKIREVEVIKETDKTLWVEDIDYRGHKCVRTRRKTGGRRTFHPSREAAMLYLIERAEAAVNGARNRLAREEKNLAALNAELEQMRNEMAK